MHKGNLWEGGINYTPGSAVSAGALIEQGYLIAIAKDDIAASELGAIHQEGLWEAKKENTTDTYSVGDLVYWDETNLYVTATPSRLLLGVCTKAAVATDDWVVIKLIDIPMASFIQSQTDEVLIGDFTDNTDATGFIDLDTDYPIGALILAHEVKVVTGFTGDTTAVYQLGEAGNLDRFSIITTGSVLAAGNVGCQPKESAFCVAAVTPRLTVTGASDFGLITAGKAQVTTFFMRLASAPLSA